MSKAEFILSAALTLSLGLSAILGIKLKNLMDAPPVQINYMLDGCEQEVPSAKTDEKHNIL